MPADAPSSDTAHDGPGGGTHFRLPRRRARALALTATLVAVLALPAAAHAVTDADISVSQNGPANALNGTEITFTVTVANNGPDDAATVTLTDALPAGATFVSFTQNSGPAFNCTTPAVGANGANGTVACSVPALPAGASASFGLTVRVEGQPPGTIITNVARVDSTFDPVPENNDAAAAVVVDSAADLAVVKTGPSTVAVGQTATYTLTATNSGPSDATGVTVTDTLPDGLSGASATTTQGTCTYTASTNVVTCDVGDLADGASATVTVTARAGYAAAGQTLTNSADVSGDQPDPDSANDASTADTTVGPAADVHVETVALNSAPSQQRTFGYRITASNDGPSAAQDVELTDTLPGGVRYESVQAPVGATCNAAGATVTCELGTLAKGTDRVVDITVTAAEPGRQTNTATVSSPTVDPDPANNTSSADADVRPTANLALTMTAPGTVAAGGQLTYTLKAANTGPSAATAAVITDTLPDGVAFVGATTDAGACTHAGGTITCRLGGLAVGKTATVAITVQVASGLAEQRIVNTATVGSVEADLDPADNTASHGVQVALASNDTEVPVSALSLTDKVRGGHGRTELGRHVTFLVGVRNRTGHPATHVSVRSTFAGRVKVVSIQPQQGTCSRKTLKCKLGRLAAGRRVTIRFVVVPEAVRRLRHTVAVTFGHGAHHTSSNAHAEVKVITRRTKFQLVEKAARKAVEAGHKVTFAVRATNRGHHAAANVRVCYTPGSGMTFAGRHGAKLSRGRACWTVRYWPSGRTRTFEVTVRVNRNVTGTASGRVQLQARNAKRMTRKATIRVRGAERHGGGVTG